ncbi:MAG: HAD family hydrolase [Rhodospirillaceae bacterium]
MDSSSADVTRPRAVLFDWDNTLVDTMPVIRDALNTTLTRFGHAPWTMEETRQRVRKSVRDRFPSLFGDRWRDAADMFYSRYEAIHMEKLAVAEGAAELLDRVASRQLYLGVVSNKRGDLLRAEVDHLGWSAYFGAIVGANDAARDKPARDPVDMALKPVSVPAGPDVWFVGDADIDIECAKNANLTAVLVGNNGHDSEQGFETHPALHFDDCMALCKFVDSL